MRTWLNQTFYHTAFVNAEQKAVEVQIVGNSAYGDARRDSVSLLSIDDMQQENLVMALYDSSMKIADIVKNTELSRSTVNRMVKNQNSMADIT